MKLHSLQLKNFRQFFGTQIIEFAAGGGNKNVTVLHGFNGSGKTALLNAFVWCLYGDTTPDFEEPNRLENERAAAELAPGKSLTVAVRLQYSVQGESFIIERTRTVSKEGDGRTQPGIIELAMWKIGAGGAMQEVGGSEATKQLKIEQLLPKGLYPFFFFNGERVEKLASADAYDDVEHGIKTLLDVEVFERAMTHLRGAVAGDLAKELKQYGGSELSEALAEEERLESEKANEAARSEELLQTAKKLGADTERLEDRQAQIAGLSALTSRRSGLRNQFDQLNAEDRALTSDLAKELSENGYLAFAEPSFLATEQLVAGARQRGEIPAKIKPQFVDDLLKNAKCICGTAISPGSSQESSLVKWREATGLAELEESISQVSAMVAPMRQRREHFFETIERIQTRRSEVLATRKTVGEDLAAVEQSIGDRSEGEDAAALAALLAKVRLDHQQTLVDIAVAEKGMKGLEEKRTDIRQKIGRLQAHDARSALIKRQRESVERVADAFEGIFKIQKETVRKDLDKRISEIWQDAAIKQYTASIGSDYRLALTKKVGGTEQPVYGASTGEKQVLALSFVASLVRTAADHLKEDGQAKVLGVPLGGDYPLVMDSAFGSLEDEYRAKVAEWVPRLAHQVVVLVSNSQWRVEVENALKDRIGREYVLELHTSKQNANRSIELNGKKYPYVVSVHDPFEYTLIKEAR